MQGRKPSTDEIAERIELCRSMLLRRVPKATIKKAFRQRFGQDIDHSSLAIGYHAERHSQPTTKPSRQGVTTRAADSFRAAEWLRGR